MAPRFRGLQQLDELDRLPEPARRYLKQAIAPDAPLATSARLRMQGTIKLGKRWLPFRARETLSPHEGFVWAGRVAGVIAGSDSLVDGEGKLDWKLLGVKRVAHADGPDITRSDRGRVAGEAIWVPTALLPRFGVDWVAVDDVHTTARFSVGDLDVELHLTLDEEARVVSVVFDRWGDPRQDGRFANHAFGMRVTAYSTFGGITIPSAGRAGWFYGTDRWSSGEFFRYRITELTALE
jgi:hypothetical protein